MDKKKHKFKKQVTRRASSSSSSSMQLNENNMRKRSSRLSINKCIFKTSTIKPNLKEDDNLSIYSREEEEEENDIVNISNDNNDSESDFVTYKVNTNKATLKKRGRKKKRIVIDSDESDQDNQQTEDDFDENEQEEGEEEEDITSEDKSAIFSNKYTHINYLGKKHTIDTFKSLDVITDETIDTKNYIANKQQPATNAPELPKVNVQLIEDYSNCSVDYKLPVTFIKYIETTNEELDEEIEYDMDEEDTIWLDMINEQRLTQDSIDTKITQEQFEILMDRLEKESYFQSSGTGKTNVSILSVSNLNSDTSLNQTTRHNDSSNEDALCCICLDGECLNTNAILFCDMCNLAVHQECYGVPYIPEGQWLCRRCIQSPSAGVNCILCPNRYGAFKQTDRGLWCHVICAIWIPEVHFANTVFLEPVIGIENIDRARWKLMCYICRKKNAGACIQCDKNNCYTAFHVTCAQQAGLYMNINEEQVPPDPAHSRGRKRKNPLPPAPPPPAANNNNNSSNNIELKRRAYCDIHTPIETLSPRTRKAIQSTYSGVECEEAMKRAQRMRMKKARKILAERRNAPPVVSMPVISKERCDEILNKYLNIELKEKFFARLMNYWTLKRCARNGVPILRRLQQAPGIKKKEVNLDKTIATNQLEANDQVDLIRKSRDQLAYWKKIRQDLETMRLLMEMIRKRERIKRECIRVEHLKTIYELNSFNGIFLQRLLDILRDLDKKQIFHQPVDLEDAPTYLDEIKHPMDFSTMQEKINKMQYDSFTKFEADFDLIINNCLNFNQKNSIFYKMAFKIREQATSILKQAKRIYTNNLEDDSSNLKSEVLALNDKLNINNEIDSRRASVCSNETNVSVTSNHVVVNEKNKKIKKK